MAQTREYVWHGFTFLFRDGHVSEGAVLKTAVSKPAPVVKQRTVRNKVRRPQNKAA